jgi:ribosome-binding protein aMBF1 (putative translation factor)
MDQLTRKLAGAGLAKQELALAAELESLTIRTIEHGRCSPQRGTLEKLARVLGAL